MPKLKYLILLFTMLSSSYVWADKIYAIRTNSFDCDFCAYDLELKFLKMKGVKEFDADIDGVLVVKTDNSVKFNEAVIKKLLLDNGFDYKGMTVKKK